MKTTLSRIVERLFSWFLLIAVPAIFAPSIQAQVAPPPPSVGARVPVTYFGPAPADVQKELIGPFKLLKAGDVDLKAETVTLPLYEGKMRDGRKVWYILTDTTDAANAAALGLNFSAKLNYAAVGRGARHATLEKDTSLTFESGTVDFAPKRRVVPGDAPNYFPPKVAEPGSVGDQDYSPLVKIDNAGGAIYNAPIVAFNVEASQINFCNGNPDYSLVHDKVVKICPSDQTVTLQLTEGFSFARPVLYLSMDANDPVAATLEGATLAPALKDITVGRDDSAFSAVERIFLFANGPTGKENPQRQSKPDADSRTASLPATQVARATQEIDPSRWEPILIASPSVIEVPSPEPLTSVKVRSELQELRRNLLSATPHQKALVRKWVTLNQGKQWRALLDDLSLHNVAGVPSTLRLYAALHIAIADAEVAARNRQTFYRRPHPMEMDSGIQPLVPSLSPFAYPSDLAAETGAAERILLFARPEAAGRINALVDESMGALASSGLYLASDCEAGRNLGILVAEQVLSVFERDGRPSQLVFAKEMPWEQPEAPETVRAGARFQLGHASYNDSVKWSAPQERQGVTYGDLPPWNQTLPVDPTAETWKPLILESADMFRVPAPAANSSAETMQEMEEIAKALNNRTCYTDYIVFKWANEQPGRWSAAVMDELMERYNWDAPKTARAEAILYAAMYDALLTTWHEKFRYLRPRPALLEPSLPTVILTPKHPSYPAGHGTYVAAADTVLRHFFPEDESEYGFLVSEVNNARVWAGVHFRGDMIAGNVMGGEVADAVLQRVHLDGSPGDRSKRVLGQPLVTSAFFGDGGPRYH